MHSHVVSSLKEISFTPSTNMVASLINDAFVHLHVFRPLSILSLLVTIASLPSYLLSRPCTHLSANQVLGLVAIKDLSSFLWQDRLDAENEGALSATNDANKANENLLVRRYRELVTHLYHLQDVFSCTIIATSWGFSSTSSVMGQPALRPYLPAVWNNYCTFKVIVERDRVSKFAPGMSEEEASAEKAQRWEAVEKSGFSGWVDWWGSEGWREEVREAVKGLNGGGRFSFRVTNERVVFDEDNDYD